MSKKGKTQYAILGILSLAPHSGYEIAKFCREVLTFFWNESYGQIYPQLKRLVDEGLAKKKETPGSNRRKATYSITAKGRKALAKWAAEPTSPQPVRNELLLKVMFGAEFPVELTRLQLEQLLESQKKMTGFLKQTMKEIAELDEFNDGQKQHFRMTVRLGILLAQARITWAKECLKTLE